jgi:DNA-binding NarL/FixJ family response regulator
MLSDGSRKTLARAVEGLRRGDSAGWEAIAPLTELAALGLDVAIDFTTEESLGAPLIVARETPGARLPESLTPRQRDVALALGRGLSNKAIARELGIAASTVKDHVSAVLLACGSIRRTEVAAYLHGGHHR